MEEAYLKHGVATWLSGFHWSGNTWMGRAFYTRLPSGARYAPNTTFNHCQSNPFPHYRQKAMVEILLKISPEV
jgi:hypothetical protein